jgi:hypothetical protein
MMDMSLWRPNGHPRIRSYPWTRSRWKNGGLQVRSRALGGIANKLAAGYYIRPGNITQGPPGLLAICNWDKNIDEELEFINCTKIAPTIFLNRLTWNEQLRISYDGTKWQIFLEIYWSTVLVTSENLGVFEFGKQWSYGKTTIIMELIAGSVGSSVIIKPRIELYSVTPGTTTTPSDDPSAPPTTSEDYALDDIRNAIQTGSKWIEAPARGDDVQDKTTSEVMSIADMSFFTGGNGLPSGPLGAYTGPSVTLVHLSAKENDTGVLDTFNKLYAWNGTTPEGNWKEWENI